MWEPIWKSLLGAALGYGAYFFGSMGWRRRDPKILVGAMLALLLALALVGSISC